ncbi:plasmid partitioning protein RepB [Rhizobium daejeonense]|uniref:Plasmid partitioning protein RepB n=1 Tax=Rhizobium daejeonense TaxID=240521 RepID=A0A6M1S621_9HYPH|nr:plasmid partitioning protein RepB [Rhizobium daejeonense]NGO66639.1 plasmid partitioning protein RepB [Rhizobium daejeonense]
MKGRDILKGMVNSAAPASAEQPHSPPAPHKPAGAVRAMNLSLGRLGEQAAAAKGLREAMAAGDKVVELDPSFIEIAFIQDRIPLDTDPAQEHLTNSIRDTGQQVPILVRPHPLQEGRYQAAYGHRRLRAAASLGLPVRAIVRKLTDEEVILAQGQENGPRVDLSFIERALFAHRMDTHGFDRDTIAKALSVDKPELSRLLQVAEGVASDIILAIGPAPKIGRPRWLAFAERLKVSGAGKRLGKELQSEEFNQADTNLRFERLWKAMAEPAEKKAKQTEAIRTKKGLLLASLEHGARGSKIAVNSPEFARFLSERMPALVSEFEQETAANS